MNPNNLFNGIKEMNEAYKDRLTCACEENMDRMLRSWICPKHGWREPNYQAIFDAELEKKIMADEARRERLPGDFDGLPSNEQMSYFVRGGR